MNEKLIVEYTVVSAVDAHSLAKDVNSCLKKGWVPQGGVEAESFGFYQAMIKYEEPFKTSLSQDDTLSEIL